MDIIEARGSFSEVAVSRKISLEKKLNSFASNIVFKLLSDDF